MAGFRFPASRSIDGKIKVMVMSNNASVAELAFTDYKAACPEMNKVASGRLP